jgi:RNA polymerase sigma-70 factor (ECF subfamily)
VAILARPAYIRELTPPEAVVAASAVAVGAPEARPATTESVSDRARLSALYAENGARIYRFLRDLLGDAALAADATQETFVRAFRKLPELDPSSRVSPWLFGIARNVSLELRKARFRAARHVVPGAAVPEGAASVASPESDYLGREALRVVSSALSELPEERRAMLLLRLDHGLSYDEIAVTMSCSLAKVKVESFRAREVLRAAMAAYEQS